MNFYYCIFSVTCLEEEKKMPKMAKNGQKWPKKNQLKKRWKSPDPPHPQRWKISIFSYLKASLTSSRDIDKKIKLFSMIWCWEITCQSWPSSRGAHCIVHCTPESRSVCGGVPRMPSCSDTVLRRSRQLSLQIYLLETRLNIKDYLMKISEHNLPELCFVNNKKKYIWEVYI